MPDRPCLCEESGGQWCPLHGRTPHPPAGRTAAPDPYRRGVLAALLLLAVAVALLLLATALIAAGHTAATPTPSPAPPATAPDGDAGGRTGGDH